MSDSHARQITEEQVRMYRSFLRSVGPELADKLCPGVRIHLNKLRAGDRTRTYVKTAPNGETVEAAARP